MTERMWFAWYPIRARVHWTGDAEFVIYSRTQTRTWVWMRQLVVRDFGFRQDVIVSCRLEDEDEWFERQW